MPTLLVSIPMAAQRGGYEGFFGDLCAGLPDYGWTIRGMAIPVGKRSPDWEFPSFWPHVTVIGSPWWSVRDFAAEMRRQIVREPPDVVMSYPYDAPLICGPNIPPGIRVVERIGVNDDQARTRLVHWHKYLDGIISISSATDTLIEESLAGVIIPPPPVAKIPHGFRFGSAPSRVHRSAHEPLRVIWFGRLRDGVKRVLDLVGIARELRVRNTRVVFTVLGESLREDAVLCQLAELGSDLIIHRAVSNERVYDHLQTQDVFLCTSEHEGGPRTLIEAMSCGLVPIVTDIAGYCRDAVVDGVNGFKVPVGDCAAFAEKLTALSKNRLELERMAQRGRPAVERDYSLDRMCSLTDQFLRDVHGRASCRKMDSWQSDLEAFLGQPKLKRFGPLRLACRRVALGLGVLNPIVS